MFTEKGAFRIPKRPELCVAVGGSEFPAYQYDQPGMVPEQFRLPGEFTPQVPDMLIELLAASPVSTTAGLRR